MSYLSNPIFNSGLDMFANSKVFVLAAIVFLSAQPVRAELPPSPEGIELPAPIDTNDIFEIDERIEQENCQTPACQSFDVFSWVYIANEQGRD